jgi:hypothetical protein
MNQQPTASRKDAKKRGERKEHQKLFMPHSFLGFSLRPLRFFASLREIAFDLAFAP